MARVPSVPRVLIDRARQQAGLVDTAQCESAGVGEYQRRRLIEFGSWARCTRGVYDTGQIDLARHPLDTARLRTVWLGQLAYRRGAVLGVGALVVARVEGVPVGFQLEMALPGGTHQRSRAGVRIRQVDVNGQVARVRGIYTVQVDLALAQAAASLTRQQWLACADSAVHQGLVDPGLVTVRSHMTRLRIARRMRSVADLVDGGSESPIESIVRLKCIDAGFAPDAIQREIFGADGSFLGRADLAWHLGAGRWLLVEVDGNEFHRTDEHLSRDATRQNGLVAGEHVILRYRLHHLAGDAMTAEIRDVLIRAAWAPGRALPAARPAPATAGCSAGIRHA